MAKIGVITATGCEEGETLTIIDILRRCELECDLIGLDKTEITGAHNITIKTDRVLDDSLLDYDMVVLPGGYGGADAMRNNEKLLSLLNKMDKANKYIAAICAAPLVLDRAGLLGGREYTCYPSTTKNIKSGTRKDDKIVIDKNLITSQGPATAYAFAFKLAEILGADAPSVKTRMVYFNAFDDEERKLAPVEFPALSYEDKGIRAAILMVEGFEESETMQITDLLRRANITAHTFYFENEYVFSMQKMYIKGDKKFSEEIKDYDIIIVPGGREAGAKLIANPDVMAVLKYFDENNKLIAGMCSGTTVLQAAGVIKGKKVTGYTGYDKKLTDGIFCEDVAVFDKNVITSQGPATPYPFAFKIMEAVNVDPAPMKTRLLYELAGGK